jgi:mannosyltransferase OCH1-like enzyme
MIPKIIHYCWFGKSPKPNHVLECIKTWKKYLPDYQIIEWNENNFDIDQHPYVQQAYEQKNGLLFLILLD